MIKKEPVYELLLKKIPTYGELKQVTDNECGDKLVKLAPTACLHIFNIDASMVPYTNHDIFVREPLKGKIDRISKSISSKSPNLMLQVHYGYRHPSIQKKSFNDFFNTIQKNNFIKDKDQYAHTFVAHPDVAGHPTGGAIDVTLVDKNTKQMIDMGTELRDFGHDTLTFSPFISSDAWKNRQYLRAEMIKEGFAPYDGEWWHFSYGDKEWAYYYKEENALYKQISFQSKPLTKS